MFLSEIMYIGIIGLLFVLLIGIIFIGFSLYIVPLKRTFAGDVLKAWRKKKPFILLDEGTEYKAYIVDKEVQGGAKLTNGDILRIMPDSIKHCKEVRLGVGDGEQGATISGGIMRLIHVCADHNIDQEMLNKIIYLHDEGYNESDLADIADSINEVDDNDGSGKK